MAMNAFFGRLSIRLQPSTQPTRFAARRRRFGGLELLEGRMLLCSSPLSLPGVGSHLRAVVIQTYETLVGRTPTYAEQNQLLRNEANAGQNALVPAIVATRTFYDRTAGGDANGYVTLAAATLDQFPSQAQVNHLTQQIVVHGADPQVLNQVVLSLNPPGSKSTYPTGQPTSSFKMLKQNVLINADYYSNTPSIMGASLGFTHILGVPGLNGTTTSDQVLAQGRRYLGNSQ